ncbi:hypothetical protein HDU82_001149 [Entophlyctis luteolus]|nr:hypothetical protein HDU82_001149 [Entophlyctis luteolus]
MLCVIGSELAEKIINKSIQLRVFDRALLNRMSPCSIVSLQFDSYTLATDSLLATASMTHWSSLSRLSLIGNEMITDDGLSHLKTCRSLGQLDLQLTKMTDRALVHILALKALTRLNLSYTRITSRGLQKFVTNDEVPELEVLILRGCMGITSSDTFAHLAELLLPNSLRILSVRDCPLSCPLNRPSDSRPWVLRELDVAQIPKFSDTDLGLIAEHCPQLVEVDMCGSGCGDGGQLLLKGTIDAPAEQAESDDTAAADGPELGPSARAFLTAMAQLQVVKLPSAADEGINSIVRAMCGLAADSGGGGGGEAPAASAMALTALDLRGFAHLTDAGLRGVARLHETLRVLNLSGTAVTDACLSPPARGGGVAALVRLVELHLDRTAVGNGVALAIADMATLEVLSVSDTNMADAGLSKFNAARCRFTLKRLNVANTIVTETGVCRGLHGFVALTSLNIERTRVKSLDACLLRIASEANANGVCLKDALLSGSGVRHSVADSDDI